MTSISSKDLRLTEIIDGIYSGDNQLPEFQRDFIWKDPAIKSLVESVLLGHPVGSLLILELNKDNPLFPWTNFNEIFPDENRAFDYQENDKLPPKYLVLDGQQRLTSLSKLTAVSGNKSWFLDLIQIRDSWCAADKPNDEPSIKKWIESSVDIISSLKKKKSTSNKNEETLMPLKVLKNKTSFEGYIEQFRDKLMTQTAEYKYKVNNYSKMDLDENIEELQEWVEANNIWIEFLSSPLKRLFDNYYDYHMPCVIVSEKMGVSGVCKVFTKINSSGIALGAFDLLVAVMYAQKIPLKQKFEDAMETYSLLKILDKKNKRYLLQTIALFEGVSPKTASLPETIKAEYIERSWDRACKALELACKALDENCGAALFKGTDNYLVYSPLVASLAVILDKYPIDIKDSSISRLRKHKMIAWYFAAGLKERYSDGTDARQNQDIKEMSLWFASANYQEDIPKWISEVFADFNNVTKNSSLGKSVISLLNSKKPLDFYDNKQVGALSIESCDLHHIFPRAALRKKIMLERNIQDKEKADSILKSEYQIDSMLNLTWILSDTNRNIIKDELPSKYFAEIIKQFGGTEEAHKKLMEILSGHAINEEALDCLLRDDYHGFIDERKKALKAEFKTTGFVHNLVDVDSDDE